MSESIDVFEGASALVDLMNDDGFTEVDELNFVKQDDPEDEDEDEVEEVDAEDEDEGDEPEEDSEDDEPEDEEEGESQLFEVEIDGETYEVNEEELLSGYLRNETLVKRQNELEEGYQSKVIELESDRQRLAEQLDALLLEGNVTLQKYRNVDWNALKQDDPESYRQARLEYIEAQETAHFHTQRRNQLAALDNEAKQLRHNAYLKSQHQLAEKLIPELKEEGFVDNLLKYGKSIGFTEDDIRGISDAKALFILNQARLYAESQVKRKEAQVKVSKDLPPVIKPGAPKTKAQEGSHSAKIAREKLGKTHSLRDAAAVLLDFV